MRSVPSESLNSNSLLSRTSAEMFMAHAKKALYVVAVTLVMAFIAWTGTIGRRFGLVLVASPQKLRLFIIRVRPREKTDDEAITIYRRADHSGYGLGGQVAMTGGKEVGT